MFSLSWWVILGYTVLTVGLLIAFDIYIRTKAGEGVVGHREFPKKLRWILIVGIIGTWVVLLFIFTYLFYPNIIDITIPINILRNAAFELPGILLIVVGWILMIIAMLQLGLSARVYLPGQKTRLITWGVYQFCRNPAYVGTYLSFLGIFLLVPSLVYLIGLCLFLVYQHFRILQEERFLREAFGAEYEAYFQKVGRYLPRIVGRKKLGPAKREQ
jgi:protein-S-isoprenylcysteine O-methyltransferase Ste14